MNEKTIERFWKKTKVSDEHEWNGSPCIDWTAYRMPTGYGQFQIDGEPIGAHRAAFEIKNGEIPSGLFVCHRCDRRECVNPDHLFLGTPGDNMEDRDRKGRQARGEQNGRAKATEGTVRLIKLFLERHPAQVGCKGGQLAFLQRWVDMSKTSLEHISRGTTWKHITTEGATS